MTLSSGGGLSRAALEKQGLHVIEEAADGAEALQKAKDL
jgi:hypothetical protein